MIAVYIIKARYYGELTAGMKGGVKSENYFCSKILKTQKEVLKKEYQELCEV